MLFPRSCSNSGAIAVRPADETARLGFVEDGPAEINFHFDDLAFTHGHDFSVAEFFAVSLTTFIGHENSVAVGNEILKLALFAFSNDRLAGDVGDHERRRRRPTPASIPRSTVALQPWDGGVSLYSSCHFHHSYVAVLG